MFKFKKFLFVMVTFLVSLTVSAQSNTNVMPTRWFDNTYVSFGMGTSGQLNPTSNGFDNFGKSLDGVIDLRLGKFFTPTVGLEFETDIHIPSHQFNSSTAFSFMNLGLNGMVNMNNLIHGFNGKADKVEFVTFIGGGWQHRFDADTHNLFTKGGVQVNWNINDKWQLNLIPSIMYRLTESGHMTKCNQPGLDASRARVQLLGGFTYNIGKKFKKNMFKFTQSDIDKLNNDINTMHSEMNDKDGVISKQKLIIMEQDSLINELKKTPIVDTNKVVSTSVIGFNIGESDISPIQNASLVSLANELKSDTTSTVRVLGFADKATGSPERNMELSKLRAESVKKRLIELGVDEDRILITSVGSENQPFKENDLNRAVMFLVH